MSEPDAALLKLRIARTDLVAWLDARPASVSGWSDWREIGGEWYFGDVEALRDVSEAQLSKKLAEAEGALGRFATNRACLRDVVDTAEEPHLRHVSFDGTTREFVAGSLTYSENLIPILTFFTLARGAADFLGPEGYGVALVHNYLWGDPSEQTTMAAMRLGPGGTSSFLAEGESGSAAGAFDGIAKAMMAERRVVIDQLDGLR